MIWFPPQPWMCYVDPAQMSERIIRKESAMTSSILRRRVQGKLRKGGKRVQQGVQKVERGSRLGKASNRMS